MGIGIIALSSGVGVFWGGRAFDTGMDLDSLDWARAYPIIKYWRCGLSIVGRGINTLFTVNIVRIIHTESTLLFSCE